VIPLVQTQMSQTQIKRLSHTTCIYTFSLLSTYAEEVQCAKEGDRAGQSIQENSEKLGSLPLNEAGGGWEVFAGLHRGRKRFYFCANARCSHRKAAQVPGREMKDLAEKSSAS